MSRGNRGIGVSSILLWDAKLRDTMKVTRGQSMIERYSDLDEFMFSLIGDFNHCPNRLMFLSRRIIFSQNKPTSCHLLFSFLNTKI